jgi:hypothetical protein
MGFMGMFMPVLILIVANTIYGAKEHIAYRAIPGMVIKYVTLTIHGAVKFVMLYFFHL